MKVRLDGLDDETLVGLAASYDELATDRYPQGWRNFAADMADTLRVEHARRMIERAQQHDPVGYCWYGRLTPPSSQ